MRTSLFCLLALLVLAFLGPVFAIADEAVVTIAQAETAEHQGEEETGGEEEE